MLIVLNEKCYEENCKNCDWTHKQWYRTQFNHVIFNISNKTWKQHGTWQCCGWVYCHPPLCLMMFWRKLARIVMELTNNDTIPGLITYNIQNKMWKQHSTSLKEYSQHHQTDFAGYQLQVSQLGLKRGEGTNCERWKAKQDGRGVPLPWEGDFFFNFQLEIMQFHA